MTSRSAWYILSCRYGGDIRTPSLQDLSKAAAELFHETLPGMAEADYAEHPCAALRYGFDDGPLFIVEGYRGGTVILSKYADADFENLIHEVTLNAVKEQQLLTLWTWLSDGTLDMIRTQYPECGW